MEYFNVHFIAHQVFWKPAFNVVHFYFFNAPKWTGGYGGLPSFDVCSMITGISSNMLVKASPELCEESISTLVNGYATLLIAVLSTVLLVLVIREFIPLIRHIIPAYFARIDLLKREQATKERNQLASNKSAETRAFNIAITAFSKTVITVLKADGDDANKVKWLMSAFNSMHPKTMLENDDEFLMLK